MRWPTRDDWRARLIGPRPKHALVAALLLLLLAVTLIWPLLEVVLAGFQRPDGQLTTDYLRLVLGNPVFQRGLFKATLIASGTTLLALGLALPLAVIATRYEFRGRALLSSLLLVPMVLPPFVGAIGMRLLLVRRREGDPADDAVRSAVLVDTVSGRMARRTVSSAADLVVDSVAAMAIDDFGERLDGPVFLVCTNGKRDACCALRGNAVYAALAQHVPPDELWVTSHQAGHRFAANVLLLPWGIQLGRLAPESAVPIVEGARRGIVSLDPE